MTDDVLAQSGWIAPEVHQAEGALCARLDISISQAAAMLRRLSQRAEEPLIEVARHVLTRTPPPAETRCGSHIEASFL